MENNIVIVGAGVAGLTLGYKLAKQGYLVTIVEKEATVGGLARSFQYGDFIFDIGPHRFHTEDPKVLKFLDEVLGKEVITIPRKSGVWMFGKFHDWPLRPKDMFRFPFKVMLHAALDLFTNTHRDGEDFESYILNRYGETLYRVFFEPYTEKFLHIKPKDLHRDWAISGIDRAVIDKKVSVNSALDLLRTTLMPKPIKTEFLYPAHGGINVFAELLARGIRENKGQILLNTTPTSIKVKGGKIVELQCSNKEKFAPDQLIWTAPINVLTNLVDMPDPGLRYLAIVCFNVEVEGPPRHDYQWCYFGGYDTLFNRSSIPVLFSPATTPEGTHGICIEVSCIEGDACWRNPEALAEPLKFQLKVGGMCEDTSYIRRIHIERIPNTYPIYEMGFHQRLKDVRAGLGQIANLSLLGRTGTFWYNNMDHSIRMALDMVEDIVSGESKQKTYSRKL
jgi:protoporphyrinogen oxidase